MGTKLFYYIFIVFLVPNLNFSQDANLLTVEYVYSNDIYSKKETLVLNGSKAVYFRPPFSQTNTRNITNDGNGEIFISAGDIDIHSTILFSDSKSIRHYTLTNDTKRYIVEEPVTDLKWTILNSNKTISGYKCKKATLDFRGRSYEAFITPDITTMYGPFKFNGLPGLIMEMTSIDDKDGTYHSWKVQKISSSVHYDDKILDLKNYKGIYIKIKDFIKLKEDQSRRKSEISNSRLPQNTKVTKVVYNRLGIEKIYEWETQE